MRNLIVILGPTASGKSKLGVTLAKKFKGVVISADSRQVYRGLDIGTAKITKPEMHGVKHFLLDVASPKSQYSVARYVKDVQRVLRTIPESTPVFLVGGTPFYIKAITTPLAFSPIPPNPALRRRLAKMTTTRLIARLQAIALDRAKTVDPANRRRLIRAIEIASFRPPPPAKRGAGAVPAFQNSRILKLGIGINRKTLYRRIDQRVDLQLNKIIAEVKKLHHSGLTWKRLESFGLEYRFTSQYLQGRTTKPEAAERIKFGSHDFARRQLTWWRNDPEIHWVFALKQAEWLTQKFLS